MIMIPETFDCVSLFAFATAMEFSKVFPEDFRRISSQGSIPENTLIPLKGPFDGSCACIVGVGILNFSLGLSQILSDCRQRNVNVSVVINLGICGAYPNKNLDLLDVVRVDQDLLGDFGCEEADGSFTSWTEKFAASPLESSSKSIYDVICGLHPVAGATVNCCTGTEHTARARGQELDCDVESMEGAACFFVCKKFDVPVFQIRAVSNIASTRDKSLWKVDEALEKLRELFVCNS